jgi:hypothetical protein
MAYFHSKNHSLSKCWRALEWKMMVYLIRIWNILVYFGAIGYSLLSFGISFPSWYVCTKKNLATLAQN